MRPANRLLGMIKSARLQHATLALFTLLVLAYAAIALRSIWHAADPTLANRGARIGLADERHPRPPAARPRRSGPPPGAAERPGRAVAGHPRKHGRGAQ